MAGIKQAAKWIKQGKEVRRRSWEEGFVWFTLSLVIISRAPNEDGPTHAWVGHDDLLADDWELAD